MKKLLHDFFSLSSLERKGVVLLILIILVIMGFNLYLAHRQLPGDAEEQSQFLQELQAFERQLTLKTDSAGLRAAARKRNREQLNKTAFRERSADPVRKKTDYPAEEIHPVLINSADSADFERLPGIGPVLARRIIRYRNLLGGFYDVAQLKEVYGITDSVYNKVRPRLMAEPSGIVKLNVNEASENDLARHPYIGRYTARGIIRYRNHVHTILRLDELTGNGLIPAENMERLEKYLLI